MIIFTSRWCVPVNSKVNSKQKENISQWSLYCGIASSCSRGKEGGETEKRRYDESNEGESFVRKKTISRYLTCRNKARHDEQRSIKLWIIQIIYRGETKLSNKHSKKALRISLSSIRPSWSFVLNKSQFTPDTYSRRSGRAFICDAINDATNTLLTIYFVYHYSIKRKRSRPLRNGAGQSRMALRPYSNA